MTDTTMGGGSGLDTIIGADETLDPEAAAQFFQRGLDALKAGDRLEGIDLLERAASAGRRPEHLFRLASELDLAGEEDRAIAIYEELAELDRPHIAVLVNLAVLYEDRGDITRAERCLRQVLETSPNHERARLFWKDVVASKDMYYDEEHLRDLAKQNALLDTPVTDFELSVRARNCLKKMQIRTLGDLLRISEAELMSYKNFGETSLVEIKHMLAQKGLRLGQGLEGQMHRARRKIYQELQGKAPDHVLNKPISALDLSVRARKALQLLNIQTVGDLACRTEAELMGVKNFGATSLDEIKEKLGTLNLELRTLD
ncbi:MAG: tetratricopeptide repeat protein [Phycisphaeraceae bacterium]|nr:tetratricopeptide repeat protein [Phycisphaeraceae bacterium]